MTEMTDNNCFDVGKYQNALSDLCCGDYTNIWGDPAVDAIVELIDIAVEQAATIKRQQPTVKDAVVVVRCKNCKNWNDGDCWRLELSGPDDFCSYGERKSDIDY